MLSYNNESWIIFPALDAVSAFQSKAALSYDYKRYVSRSVSITPLRKTRGEVSHLRNVEYIHRFHFKSFLIRTMGENLVGSKQERRAPNAAL